MFFKAQFVLEDFVNAAVLIAVLLLIATVVSFLYIIVLRWVLGNDRLKAILCILAL
jgi:hypothetical protein